MNWVEKSSIEKICRLLEISERERHYRVLLTPENISVVRHNPAPYTLSVIPRPLPSHVLEGEHFVIADLWRLVSGSASSSRNSVIEASSRVQGAGSTSRSSASSSGGSSSSPPAPGQRTRSNHLERLFPPAQVAGPAPQVVKVKRKRASKRAGVQGGGFRTLGSCRHERSPGFGGRRMGGENDGVARSLRHPQEEATGDFQQ